MSTNDKDAPKKSRGARMKESATKATKKATWFSRQLMLGNFLSSTFFYRHRFTIIIAVILLMAFIAFKFESQIRMEQIAQLERELAVVNSEAIRERSLYRSNTRESMMQARIDSLHLKLQPQTQPPFKIKYKK